MSGKRIALSLVTCMMAASYLTPHAAFAAKDPELSFYPSQKWTVENLSKAGGSDLKTCAVSNTFNNGFVVQIAGSQDGFINLNIDFRQASFTQNKLYEVQYTIPGSATQTLPTKAFKDSLLVTDLRSQKQFSESLKTSGVVDIKIQNNEFRLYLTGLSATMKDYSECVQPEASMAQIAAPSAALMPKTAMPVALAEENIAPPPPMPTTIDLTAAAPAEDTPSPIAEKPKASLKPNFGRERYTDKLAKQMRQNSEIISVPVQIEKTPPVAEEKTAQKLPTAPEMFPLRDTSVPPAAQEISAIPAPTAAAKTASIEPQATAVLPAAPKNMEAPTVVNNKPAPLKAEIDLTQIDPNASLVKPTASAKAALKPIENAVEISAVETIKPNAQQLAEIEPSAGTPLPEANDREFVDMRNKIVDLEQQLSSLKRDNEMLDSELKATLKDSADERTSISSNNWDLERATMRYNEAELQIARLGRQLQSSKSQCDMEKSELKTMLFDPKLTDQQQLAKLSSLEEDLDRTKTDLIVQKRTYEERIKLLEEQLNKQP